MLPTKYSLYGLHSTTSVQMLLCEANNYIYSNNLTCIVPKKHSLSFFHELLHVSQ